MKIRVKENSINSINYCSGGKSKQSNDIKHTTNKPTLDAKNQLNHQNEYLIEIRIIKESLDALYRDKALGAQVRSDV